MLQPHSPRHTHHATLLACHPGDGLDKVYRSRHGALLRQCWLCLEALDSTALGAATIQLACRACLWENVKQNVPSQVRKSCSSLGCWVCQKALDGAALAAATIQLACCACLWEKFPTNMREAKWLITRAEMVRFFGCVGCVRRLLFVLPLGLRPSSLHCRACLWENMKQNN